MAIYVEDLRAAEAYDRDEFVLEIMAGETCS